MITKRRTWLWLLFVSSLTAVFPTAATAADRPNILWIFVEDLSPWLGCYGNTVNANHTPTIDQLAAEGVLFERAYVPAPVCSACRSAIITGVMQTTTGTHRHRSSRTLNGVVPPELQISLGEVNTIPQLLRDAGYFTFNSGKDDYNFHYDRRELYSVGTAKKYLAGQNPWQGNHAQHMGSFTTDVWNARDNKQQPWFGQITLWGGKAGDKHVRAGEALPAASIGPPAYYPDTKVFREAWTLHHNAARGTDHRVAQVLEQLKLDGELANTIVFFFSDHGNNHSLRHKQFCYEGGVHVPLIVAGNHRAITANTRRSDLVSGLDISATTLALAGVQLPDYLHGRDLFAKDHQPRQFVVSARDRCDYSIDRIRTIRTDRFRYLRNGFPDRPLTQAQYRDDWPTMLELKRLETAGELPDYQSEHWFGTRPTEELYDLETDPNQLKNLAVDETYSAELVQHREILDRWITDTNDLGQLPESAAQLKAVYDFWKDEPIFRDADTNPEFDSFK